MDLETEGPGSRPCVLVVDDEQVIRQTLLAALTQEGWSVATARDGSDALEWLKSHPAPIAIVLDLMMPMMDGQTFMGLLRTNPILAGTPVIQISAGVNTAIPGVAARLDKPFHLGRLLHLLNTYAMTASATPRASHPVRPGSGSA